MKRLLSFFVAGGLAACSSAPKAPPVGDRTNPYFVFFERQPVDFKKSFRLTPFALFTLSPEVFKASLREHVAHDGVLASFAPQPAHGDFHPLQARVDDGVLRLVNFEAAAALPWWWDLLRMESGASVLAAERSLKFWREGPCLEAYARTLANEAAPFAPAATLGHERRVPADLEQWPVWKQASKEVAPGLRKASERALPPSLNLREIRALSNAAPQTRARYLLRASDDSLWELREIDNCEPYLASLRVLRADATWRCLTTSGRHYVAWPYPRAFSEAAPEDFTSEAGLAAHVGRMCQTLAEAQARAMSPAARRELALVLTRNRLLLDRLKAYAQAEAQRLIEGYRAAL